MLYVSNAFLKSLDEKATLLPYEYQYFFIHSIDLDLRNQAFKCLRKTLPAIPMLSTTDRSIITFKFTCNIFIFNSLKLE